MQYNYTNLGNCNYSEKGLNMAKKAQAKKKETLPGTVFTKAEIESILGGCSNRGLSGIRNRALLALMFGAGLRISEAIAVYKSDLDLTAKMVHIRHGKGNKSRRVAILQEMLPYVETWIAKRESALGLNGKAPLFCTHSKGEARNQSGKALSAAYVRGFLNRLEAKLGLEKRIHSHAFRHSLADQLVKNNIPLNTIQWQLGHSSPSTTAAYIARISPMELVKAFENIRIQ